MAANEDQDRKDVVTTDKAYQAAVDAVSAKPTAGAGKAKGNDPKPAIRSRKVEPRVTKSAPPAVAKADAKPVSAPTPAKPLAAKVADAPKAEPKVEKPQVAEIAPQAKPITPAVPAAPIVAAEPAPAAVPPPISTAAPAEKVVPVKAAAPEPAVEAPRVKPVSSATVTAAATPKAAQTVPSPAFVGLFTNILLEDITMDMSTNFSGFQDAISEAQTKAKEVFEKSTKMLGEVGDFTKGNVEAVIESGKILAEGVQSLGSELVAEGRSAFEVATGDIKELAAAKSPTDFFKIQSDMVRKNFDSAVAYGSKNSEAVLKLVSDVLAPISGRVSIAIEKARSTTAV